MKRLYFTFGSDPAFPYGRDDFVIVIGKGDDDCIAAFKEKFPNRPGSNAINCASWYTDEQWEKEVQQYYKNTEPKETLISDRAYGTKPEGFDPLWLFIPAKGELVYVQEGSGCNLEEEDINNGNVDYLDYTTFKMGDGEIGEVDGGDMLLPFLVRDHYRCLADAIPDLLEFAYDDKLMDAQILDSSEFDTNI